MNVHQEFPPCARSRPSEMTVTQATRPAGRLRGVPMTAVALAALWAGMNPGDIASWAIGVPTVMLGAAVSLLYPSAALPPISIRGAAHFTMFVVTGVMRGALDVGWRSLNPAALRPGFLVWQTGLPEGGPRRLFALTITLLPGTLTARLEGDTLIIHSLDRSAATRADLGALEARIAGLFLLAARQERT